MNRKLSRYAAGQPKPDPNPGAEPDGVEADADLGHAQAVAEQLAMAEDNDETTCSECDTTAAYDDPADALGNPSLPSVPLCRSHILEHA